MKKILSLLRPFRRELVLSLIFMLSSTVLSMITPIMSKNLVTEITQNITPDPTYTGPVAEALPHDFYVYSAVIVAAALVSCVFGLCNTYFSTVVSTNYSKALRSMMFRKVSSLGQSDIDRIGVASLITRTTSDVSNIHEVVLTTLRNVLSVPVLLIGGLVMVFVTAPNLAGTILAIIPVFLIILLVFFKFISPMFLRIQKQLDRLNRILREKISGIRVIRAFRKTEDTDRDFNKTNLILTGYALKAARILSLLMPFLVVIIYGIVILLLYRVLKGINALDPAIAAEQTKIAETIGSLTAFLSYFMMVMMAIAQVIAIVGSFPRAQVSARRINTVLEAKSDVVESENPVTPTVCDGSVEFRNVVFRYKEAIKDDRSKDNKAIAKLSKFMGIDDSDRPENDANLTDKERKKLIRERKQQERRLKAEAREEKKRAEAEKNEPAVSGRSADGPVSGKTGSFAGGMSLPGGSAPPKGVAEPVYTPGSDADDEITTESRAALNSVSFSCRHGETTALIGGTGCGKSTVISLIPRLYDATEGEVLIDGVNVRDIAFDELQKKIAYIPQKAFLFSGTIRDNIRFGKEDASDAEIWRALEIAQAKSFVAALPDGLDSLVSQGGTNFSGGQRQRLAIARAVVKQAEIYIFDDSFSALDLATDARLRASIKAYLSESNIILVAQRIGTIMDADRIIVMDKGSIIACGRHEELLDTCELYRSIAISQLGSGVSA
ncbi:MAG: ABC transporter ATP-binding protein/permease [Clostridia bacterium]|nr:ABC transporter ATP-binding protein/permease [Clostridia bacterium]